MARLVSWPLSPRKVLMDPVEAMTADMTADPREASDWTAGREAEGAQGAAGAHINAKALQQKAPYEMSFLMHTVYGLDQYPQYLYKWPASQIDEAIELLDAKLRAARTAREALRERDAYVAAYEPLHPKLRAPKVEDVLTPRAVEAARLMTAKPSDEIRERVRAALGVVEEVAGVYSFELLTADCCQRLSAEMASYSRYRDAWISERGQLPGGVLRERAQLVDAGLESFEAFLFDTFAKPLSKLLYGSQGTRDDVVGDVDTSHAYVVGYGPSEIPEHGITRRALVPHVDDAEVTINVCLSNGFTGGALRFHGLRSTETTTIAYELPCPNEYSYQHRRGRAVIHLGNHFHEVLDVTSGERHVLIMWMRSWRAYRASHCPCCLKFRRQFCVCSPEWN